MRILHVDTGSEMRGGQHQVLLLMYGLARSGHESVLLARQGGRLALAASEAGYPVHDASLTQVWAHSRRADLVHAHDARGHTMAAMGARCPVVVSRRVAFPLKRHLLSRWKYRRVVRYLAVSQFVKGQLMNSGVPSERIDVVYDAVPEQDRDPVWSPEYPAVALASHDSEKGRDLVEEASRVSGIKVVFSNRLVEDLQHASMFVYVSRSEGLGSAALLALSIGVPVIASAVGGMTELFEDGISGLYITNDCTSLVRAMRRLLGDKTLAARLIAHGRIRVRERFSERQLIEGTLASYRRALVD